MTAPLALLDPLAPAAARPTVRRSAGPALPRPVPLSRGTAVADLRALGAADDALVVHAFRLRRRG